MSKKLQQIEWLSGGKALLEKRPANDFFPAPHWYLQTADGGRFGNISKREVVEAALDFLWEQAVEQERGADGYDFTDPNDNPYILSGEELARAEAAARSR